MNTAVKVAHTPGPWWVCADGESRVHAGFELCDLRGSYAAKPANARLIAAAPELLAALAQLLTEVDDMTKRTGWAGNGGRDMARAALAKVQP